MSDIPTAALRVADLSTKKPTRFALEPDAKAMAAIAAELGLQGLRKLRFKGELRTEGKHDWRLDAELGATVTQPCVVTLAPVTSRIDEKLTRRFVADLGYGEDGEEVEMPEDDSVELLGEHIDPAQVMLEALALALPLYPRAEGAELGEAAFTEPGQTPMTDEETKPFSGLAALRDQLSKKE